MFSEGPSRVLVPVASVTFAATNSFSLARAARALSVPEESGFEYAGKVMGTRDEVCVCVQVQLCTHLKAVLSLVCMSATVRVHTWEAKDNLRKSVILIRCGRRGSNSRR